METQTAPPANEEVGVLNTNDLYREFEANNPGLSVPLTTETPPAELAERELEPTISSEVIFDEPGQGEVTPPATTFEVGEISTGNLEAALQSGPDTSAAALPSETPVETSEVSTLDYKIKSGDVLYSLAKKHGTTVNAILAANPGLDPRKLRVGKMILMPRNSVATSRVEPSAPSAAVAVSSGKIYKVKRGDTLTRIATRNGVSLSALRKANDIRSDLILVGQKLQIPVANVASASQR